jgi:sn-glycerol 3-phosphate transport system substrate-binding protein
MKLQLTAAALAAFIAFPAQAQTEIQWWHSMGGALGEWVNDLAKDFNATQKDYKIVPTFKGSYDESMTAASPPSGPAMRRTSCRCSRSAPPP